MRFSIRVLVGATLLSLLLTMMHVTAPTAYAPPLNEQVAVQAAGSFGDDMATPPTTTTPAAAGLLAAAPPTAEPTMRPTETVEPTPTPPRLRTRFRPQPGDVVSQITPGVIHVYRATPDPLKINILLFDMTAPEFDLRVALGDGWLSGRTRTTYMVEQNDAIAGINGDLFSADGIPQGMTMIDGRVAMAPKYRATFAWSKDREPFIGYFTDQWTWQAEVVAPNGKRSPTYQLNWFCETGTICLFNRFAQVVPARVGDVKMRLAPSGRVSEIAYGEAMAVPPQGRVLQGTGAGAQWLLNNVEFGDQVDINISTDPSLSDFTHAISGGPIMLQEGEFFQDCFCTIRDCSETNESGLLCEDFTYDWKDSHYRWVRMPRTGVGFDEEKQTLIVAVVDGYQLGYSRGITQEEFADLFKEFGGYTAMELDGGGSSTMVLEDEVINQPSDDTGERYVANALLFLWDEDADQTPTEVFDPQVPRPAVGPR